MGDLMKIDSSREAFKVRYCDDVFNSCLNYGAIVAPTCPSRAIFIKVPFCILMFIAPSKLFVDCLYVRTVFTSVVHFVHRLLDHVDTEAANLPLLQGGGKVWIGLCQ